MQQLSQRKISIIVPVYNSEKHLCKMIESIIEQEYSHWELILVDDGSTDRSGDVCDEYAQKDTRIKVYHQKNGGVSVARNKALDKISGDYVTFIDSDDWVEPSYLLRFMEFPYADDQIVFQGYFMDYVGAVAKESTKEIPKQGRILHLGAILGKMFATPIIKLHNIRFDERLRLHEDHVFYYECLKYARQFDFSSYAGYHYMHYGEQSLSRRLQSTDAYFLASELLLDYYQYDITVSDNEYKRFCIQKFGLNQMVMGVFSLYFSSFTKKHRLDVLRMTKKHVEIFKQFYVPNSLNGKLFLFCYLHFTPAIQDAIFKIATALLGRKFKTRLNLK